MSKAAAKLSKPPITIPDLVIDPGTKQRYKKGRLLGKASNASPSFLFIYFLQGGFAHCYELIDLDTNTVYAGKVVPKTLLTKPHQRDKVRKVFVCPYFYNLQLDGHGDRHTSFG